MARQTAEGGKWNRTVRTRGVVRGVTPRQDGIGCYATGHQSYLYTGPLVPLFPPQAPLLLIRSARLEAQLWDVDALGFDWFGFLEASTLCYCSTLVFPHITSFLSGWVSYTCWPSWDTESAQWSQSNTILTSRFTLWVSVWWYDDICINAARQLSEILPGYLCHHRNPFNICGCFRPFWVILHINGEEFMEIDFWCVMKYLDLSCETVNSFSVVFWRKWTLSQHRTLFLSSL